MNFSRCLDVVYPFLLTQGTFQYNGFSPHLVDYSLIQELIYSPSTKARGLFPVYFLNARLKVAFELKPASRAMPRKVRFS